MSIWQFDDNVESIIRIHRDQYKYSISARYRLVSIAGKLQSFGGPKNTGDDGRFPLEVATIAHRRCTEKENLKKKKTRSPQTSEEHQRQENKKANARSTSAQPDERQPPTSRTKRNERVCSVAQHPSHVGAGT